MPTYTYIYYIISIYIYIYELLLLPFYEIQFGSKWLPWKYASMANGDFITGAGIMAKYQKITIEITKCMKDFSYIVLEITDVETDDIVPLPEYFTAL